MMPFPKSTEYGKILPKAKLLEKADIRGQMRQSLTDGISRITLTHKLAGSTLNIDAGKIFPEIMVIKLTLKKRDVNEKILDAIDTSIRAAFVLFILEHNGQQRLSIAYKNKNADRISITKRWTSSEDFHLELEGRSIDAVYEGFLRQISGGSLITSGDISLKEKVAHAIDTEKVKRQIARLETKMKNSPQLKRKLEIKAQIKALSTDKDTLIDHTH